MNQTAAQKKGLWGMSRPLLVEQALQFFVPVQDTFFLSQVSDTSASAVGAMTPVVFFCTNILLITVYSGASVASQRIGAGRADRASATIGTVAIWSLVLGVLLAAMMYALAPSVSALMGLPGAVQDAANVYLRIICWLLLVFAGKQFFQAVLNIYGQPQWNMVSNIIFFSANVLCNAIVVYGWFGVPKMGLAGVAWASVVASLLAVLVSGVVVLCVIRLRISWAALEKEFYGASQHILRITMTSMIEPMSFNVNMIILNSFVARLGTLALAAKVYTFNTFLLGMVVTVALSRSTEILICQMVGAGEYERATAQMKQSLKAAIGGSLLVVLVLLIFHRPIMDLYSNDSALIAMAFWMFLLAALSEFPRAVNIMVGGALRATGDGLQISIIGPLFMFLVSVPLAWFMAFQLGWGVYGIMLAAVLDEGGRAILYWRRWRKNRWQHSHVHARERRQGV